MTEVLLKLPASGAAAIGGHLKFDLDEWCTPRVVISLVSALVTVLVGAAFLGYLVFFRMPDLDHGIRDLRGDIG
jgi:hypothetical protein